MMATGGSFVVLLPVKSPGSGKSRLIGLTDGQRARLAAAFAADVVDAALATPDVQAVLAISDDEVFAASLAARGAFPCDDPGHGLNAALRHGAHRARQDWPSSQPVAVLADLPALRAADLGTALSLATRTGGPCFVRDADGTGTTFYSAPYDAFDPHFGAGSAAAHEDVGARELAGALPSLRHDVDDLAALTDAIRLGVGGATDLVVRSIPLL